MWLGVCSLPKAAEPDTAGRDPTQQQEEDSQQDKPGQGKQDPTTGLTPGHEGPAPWGQLWPEHPRQENGQKKRRECLSLAETSVPARAGPEELARPGSLLLSLSWLSVQGMATSGLGLTPRTHCPGLTTQSCAQTSDHVHKGLPPERGRRKWAGGKQALKGSPPKSQGCGAVRGWDSAPKGQCLRCWGQEPVEGPRAFPPVAGRGECCGSLSPGARLGGGQVGVVPGTTVGPGSAPQPPLTPRATGCSSGPGAGTCGDGGTWSKRDTRSVRPPRPSLPTGRGQAPAPSPRLTGPKGRSCLPRSPAPPVGIGVSSGRGAPSADLPRRALAARLAPHLRRQQQQQQQRQERAGSRRPREHALCRPEAAAQRPSRFKEAPPTLTPPRERGHAHPGLHPKVPYPLETAPNAGSARRRPRPEAKSRGSPPQARLPPRLPGQAGPRRVSKPRGSGFGAVSPSAQARSPRLAPAVEPGVERSASWEVVARGGRRPEVTQSATLRRSS